MNALLIAGIVVIVLAMFTVLLYNSLIRLRNNVKNSLAQIDVQLKRRSDLIPNLVEAVKGYMKHEKSTLTELTKARSAILSATTLTEKAKASNQISETLKSLFAVAENYPQLKANENFMQLQQELSDTENKISYTRQVYNDMVLVFNNKIQVFPNNIFANMLKFAQEQFFETSEEEKKAPKVAF